MSDDPKLLVVDFTPRPEALEPAMRVVQRKYSDCRHRNQPIDEASRTVCCRECGASLDPFEVIVNWAREWERYAECVRYLMHEERQLRTECAKLIRRARNLGATVRRWDKHEPPDDKDLARVRRTWI